MMKSVWKAYENAAETMGECSMNDFATCRLAAFLQLGQGTRVSTTSKM